VVEKNKKCEIIGLAGTRLACTELAWFKLAWSVCLHFQERILAGTTAKAISARLILDADSISRNNNNNIFSGGVLPYPPLGGLDPPPLVGGR